MWKEKESGNDAIEANIKINEQFKGGKIDSRSTQGRMEAESANLKMQDLFRGGNDQPAKEISPAFVYNPSMELSPESEE